MSSRLGKRTSSDANLAAAETLYKMREIETAQSLISLSQLTSDPEGATYKDVESVVPLSGGKRKVRGAAKSKAQLQKEHDDEEALLRAEQDALAAQQQADAETARLDAIKTAVPTSNTVVALKNLVNLLKTSASTAASSVDSAIATAVGYVPSLTKALATGAATKFVVNHPTMFANIADGIRSTGVSVIKASFENPAKWDEYVEAVKIIAGGIGATVEELKDIVGTPYFVIVTAGLIMKARAAQSNKSITDIIKSDVSRLASVVSSGVSNIATVALGQYSAFLYAYNQSSGDKALAALREIAAKVKKSKALGEGAIASTAAMSGQVAVQSGLPGSEGAVVPGSEPKDLSIVLKKLSEIEPASDESKAAAALAKEATAEEVKPVGARRRHRKTRRAPKRRSTRKMVAPIAPMYTAQRGNFAY